MSIIKYKKMNYTKMQPVPSPVHKNNCLCDTDVDKQICYLWIHCATAIDHIITFDSITAAYVYGSKYLFENSATILEEGAVPEIEWDTAWTSTDGTNWIIKGGFEHSIVICEILTDIKNGINPRKGHWCFMNTQNYQMLIGLVANLPTDQLNMCEPQGYFLSAHDNGDMPPLFYHAEWPPSPPTPIILGPNVSIPWHELPDGERSPHLLHSLSDNYVAPPSLD